MENLKIRVNNEAESKEAQELFGSLGFEEPTTYQHGNKAVFVFADMNINRFYTAANQNVKEITLPELRALVSLHKNPINMDKVLSEVRSDALGLLKDKPVKELLLKDKAGNWHYNNSDMDSCPAYVEVIEIPKGADVATSAESIYFWNTKNNTTYVDGEGWVKSDGENLCTLDEYLIETDYRVIWQRHTQPEELPFVDDECYTNKSNGGFKMPKDKPCDISKWSEIRGESINDQYAEIEQVRQEHKLKNDINVDEDSLPDFLFEDTVNHPSHYASGEIECIDAMEAMLTPEQFIGYLRGNAFKYQWRYENKGGITDLEKAQWYLNKLISRIG